MTIDDVAMFNGQAVPHQRVAYVPNHAHDNINHPDVEWGYITGVTTSGDHLTVFIKFDNDVNRLGWQKAGSKGCDLVNLVRAGSKETYNWKPR